MVIGHGSECAVSEFDSLTAIGKIFLLLFFLEIWGGEEEGILLILLDVIVITCADSTYWLCERHVYIVYRYITGSNNRSCLST